VRRRLVGPDARLDFPILYDVKDQGGVEYFAFPVPSVYGSHMVSYTTDRPSGFSDEEIAKLRAVSDRLAILADTHIQRQIAENVLIAYLGSQTGPMVLAGKIRRGTGDTINAVLWSSDVRSFTAFSDRVPGQQVIAKLDQIFDAQARAIAKHGGEILKFIGDGLLAIFPVDAPDQAAQAAGEALTAASEALESVQALGPHSPGEASLRMVIALHYGSAIYGNIGAADRLDFTVIGPDVNLVSRIEAVAKSLDLPLVVSDDFARAYGAPLPRSASTSYAGSNSRTSCSRCEARALKLTVCHAMTQVVDLKQFKKYREREYRKLDPVRQGLARAVSEHDSVARSQALRNWTGMRLAQGVRRVRVKVSSLD
jgi:adenylate cyclase